MSDRDPRLEPKRGDVFAFGGTSYRVSWVATAGVEVEPRDFPYNGWISEAEWDGWAAGAEVLRTGEEN